MEGLNDRRGPVVILAGCLVARNRDSLVELIDLLFDLGRPDRICLVDVLAPGLLHVLVLNPKSLQD